MPWEGIQSATIVAPIYLHATGWIYKGCLVACLLKACLYIPFIVVDLASSPQCLRNLAGRRLEINPEVWLIVALFLEVLQACLNADACRKIYVWKKKYTTVIPEITSTMKRKSESSTQALFLMDELNRSWFAWVKTLLIPFLLWWGMEGILLALENHCGHAVCNHEYVVDLLLLEGGLLFLFRAAALLVRVACLVFWFSMYSRTVKAKLQCKAQAMYDRLSLPVCTIVLESFVFRKPTAARPQCVHR